LSLALQQASEERFQDGQRVALPVAHAHRQPHARLAVDQGLRHPLADELKILISTLMAWCRRGWVGSARG
jgi:hypothetical protein